MTETTTPPVDPAAGPRLATVPTTPIPAPIDEARRVLTAVLQAGPVLDDTLLIAEALGVLLDVDPPYPPLGLEDDPTEPDLGIPVALRHLDQAAEQTDSLDDLCRYAIAASLLNQARTTARVRASVTP